MKDSNINKLRKAISGWFVTDVEVHGGHGMVLTITFGTLDGARKKMDICTYDDGKKHDVDEFYVALDGTEI